MFDLESLISPIDVRTFEREHWEKRPLVVPREQRDYYEGLLTLADVDEILSVSSVHAPLVRVVRNGEMVPLGKLRGAGLYGHVGVLEGLYTELRNGATISLLSLHERWKPLKRLCQSLASTFSAAVQVNVYLTPAGSRGLKPHYDTHDVFVLQTFGSKRWRLFDSPAKLPLPGQAPAGKAMGELGAYQELDLHPGEMIYIPRGWKHVAFATDSMSLHLTVGIYPVTWAGLFLNAVESVIERDARFRESLPIGFAKGGAAASAAAGRYGELLGVLADSFDPTCVIAKAAEAAALGRQPSLDGHLLDLAAASSVEPETRLRQRPGVEGTLKIVADRVHLSFHGKLIDLPAHVEPELRFVLEGEQFCAESLPGDLDRAGRLVLVKRLLEEGFLTLC